ncbi:smad nuclear-interacting protein 1-like [Littorina saxatilis]|uniref:FHA domain-containing protein n=1 Tax=Littorina saxatilis TaxID=31220 RepID=A0AAN9GGJ5_9CAEN
MVKHERHRSRSPVSKDRKKRTRDDSPTDQAHRHRHRHEDRNSHSPDNHRRKHDGHRHKDKLKNRREDRRERERDGGEASFDPDHRVKQEPTDSLGEQQRHRRQNDDRRREARQQREQGEEDTNFGRPSGEDDAEAAAPDKEKPNFELSGKLTEDTNSFRGVVVKYNEPPEARKPKRRWRLYGFKGEEALPMLPIHRQSAYLLGRDRRVADIPVDHPSCSKQHAVLQYRLTEYDRPDGSRGRKVRPYIIDLGSANGTFINNQRIDAQRYTELMERDLIKFGFSSREYVLLHENVDTSEVAEGSDTE